MIKIMMDKAVSNFIVSLIIVIFVFQLSYFIPLNLPTRLSNWLRLLGLIVSFLFYIKAVLKGVKQIRSKENSFIYNLIAIIGGTLIFLVIIFWGALLLSLNGGLPQD